MTDEAPDPGRGSGDDAEAPRPTLAGAGEFALIREVLDGVRSGGPDVRVGPGDDAAVLEGGWVISTDQTVEGIHYRPAWLTPAEVGGRAARAALSDLAAMAARPVGVLVSIAVGRARGGEWVRAVMGGIVRVVEAHGGVLLGGDLSALPAGSSAVVDVVSLGRAASPLLRSGARPGDELWVTGVLGGAAGAVRLWERGVEPSTELRRAFAMPAPRMEEARWLSERGTPRACIDLSDGLAADAAHVAAASGVRLVLTHGAVPVHPALARAPELPAAELALSGGEDYELLLAAPSGELGAHAEAFRRRFGVPLTRIGHVERGSGVAIRGEEGELTRMDTPPGHDHFPGGS